MSRKTKNLLAKAKTQLLLHHPFFAQVALESKFKVTDKVPTMATDGKFILVNPEFCDTLTVDEVMGVLAHECMHILGMHHLRIQSREHKKWNHATDYAINDLLDKDGFSLPNKDKICLDSKYANMASEKVYNLLPDPDEDENQPTFGEVMAAGSFGEDGDGDGSNQELSPEEVQVEENRVKMIASKAAAAAKMAGKLPAGMERLVEDLLERQTPWQDMLRKYMTLPATNDYSWAKPNRRYIGSGMYMPSNHSDDGMGEVIVGVDTSGSISNRELALFTSEVRQIVQDARPNKVTVLYFDTEISHVEEYDEPDAMDIEMKAYGGGGTDFRPVFNWIDAEMRTPDVVVMLTDLYGPSPDREDYETVWACLPDSSNSTPFGKRVDLSWED